MTVEKTAVSAKRGLDLELCYTFDMVLPDIERTGNAGEAARDVREQGRLMILRDQQGTVFVERSLDRAVRSTGEEAMESRAFATRYWVDAPGELIIHRWGGGFGEDYPLMITRSEELERDLIFSHALPTPLRKQVLALAGVSASPGAALRLGEPPEENPCPETGEEPEGRTSGDSSAGTVRTISRSPLNNSKGEAQAGLAAISYKTKDKKSGKVLEVESIVVDAGSGRVQFASYDAFRWRKDGNRWLFDEVYFASGESAVAYAKRAYAGNVSPDEEPPGTYLHLVVDNTVAAPALSIPPLPDVSEIQDRAGEAIESFDLRSKQ